MKRPVMRRIAAINKELLLIFSLFLIAAVLNFVLASQRIVLGFYSLPTVFSAYFYGKRHAVMISLFSIALVCALVHFNPLLFPPEPNLPYLGQKWIDIIAWGGTLVVMAYAMGALYERKESNLTELRESYRGILAVLCQLAASEEHDQHHAYRVSICAAAVAEAMGLSPSGIEDVRAAALLHDVGKMERGRDLLTKAAKLRFLEDREVRMAGMEPVNNSLHRVIPILISDRGQESILLESKIIDFAETYDDCISGASGKRLSATEARNKVFAMGKFEQRLLAGLDVALRTGKLDAVLADVNRS